MGCYFAERSPRRVRLLAARLHRHRRRRLRGVAAVATAVGDGDDGAFYDAWVAAGDRLHAEAAAPGPGHPRQRLRSLPGPPPPMRPRTTRSTAPRSSAPRSPPSAPSRGPRYGPRPPARPGLAPLASPSKAPTLPAYFLPADAAAPASRRPLVIVVNGYDATVTEVYFAIAVAASRRGYPRASSSTVPARAGPADRAGPALPARLGGGRPPGDRPRGDPARGRSPTGSC